MKKVLLVLFALVLVVCLASCSKNPVIGSYTIWQYGPKSAADLKEAGLSGTLIINKDGKGTMSMGGKTIDVSCDFKACTMTINGQTAVYVYKDADGVLTIDDMMLGFEKIK